MRTALITGATSGIGRALALELGRRGYALGLTGRREALLREVAAAVPTRAAARRMDVTDVDDVAAGLEALAEELGGLSLVVANAGISDMARVGGGNLTGDCRIIHTNLIGAMATVDAAVAYFRRHKRSGHIVGISSVAGVRGLPQLGAYCASKAGLNAYLESVRAENLRRNIRVTTLSPGFIDTPINQDMPARPFVIPVERGAAIMADHIERGVQTACVPGFPWSAFALLARNLPESLWSRAMARGAKR